MLIICYNSSEGADVYMIHTTSGINFVFLFGWVNIVNRLGIPTSDILHYLSIPLPFELGLNGLFDVSKLG